MSKTKGIGSKSRNLERYMSTSSKKKSFSSQEKFLSSNKNSYKSEDYKM